MSIFQTLYQKQGLSIIIVTHDSEVAQYCNRIIRLRDGLIVDEESITPKRAEPGNKTTKGVS